MYLTRIPLDLKKRETMFALSDPARFHGAVEGAFPGERERKLWRVDHLGGQLFLMILSPEIPQTDNIMERYGEKGRLPETRSYGPLLDRIQRKGRWRFRLVANPTVCQKREGPARGQIKAHVTEMHQLEWLARKGEKNGFFLMDDTRVVEKRWYSFWKGGDKGKKVSLLSVSFEGSLIVTDEERFRRTLTEGIGRERAYGQGFLTVAPCG